MPATLQPDTLDSPESLDTLFAVLADAQRRDVLRHLLTVEGPVEERALADALAEPGAVDVTVLGLRHVHIPALEDVGLLEWDRSEHTVSLTPVLEQLSVVVPSVGGILDLSTLSGVSTK